MDVLSQSEMRMREKMKRIRPLDHVIRRAVAEEEAEAAMAGAPAPAPAAAQAKVRFAGPSAEEEREARRHHRAAHKHRQRRHREKKPWERVHIMEEGTGDEARGASAGRSDATKTREDYAQEGERPVSFAASVGRFDGKPKNMKAYPHHLAPGVLRRQMGMASRTADLNAELAKAREGERDSFVEGEGSGGFSAVSAPAVAKTREHSADPTALPPLYKASFDQWLAIPAVE